MFPVLEMPMRKLIWKARNRLVCSIKIGIYHMLTCWVPLSESYKEVWEEQWGFGQGCPSPAGFSGSCLLLHLVKCWMAVNKGPHCIRERKKLELVTIFLLSTCNNVLKYKNSIPGKDPAFVRLVSNTAKQISLVVWSLNC